MLPPPHLPKRGAPLRNRNRLKHGRYSGKMIALRKEVTALIGETDTLIRMAEKLHKPDQTV